VAGRCRGGGGYIALKEAGRIYCVGSTSVCHIYVMDLPLFSGGIMVPAFVLDVGACLQLCSDRCRGYRQI